MTLYVVFKPVASTIIWIILHHSYISNIIFIMPIALFLGETANIPYHNGCWLREEGRLVLCDGRYKQSQLLSIWEANVTTVTTIKIKRPNKPLLASDQFKLLTEKAQSKIIFIFEDASLFCIENMKILVGIPNATLGDSSDEECKEVYEILR